MIFENTEIFNIEGAIRGMRNALASWNKSDSIGEQIGANDLKLAQKLIEAGDPSHRKFLRQIFVSVDITAPLFWWKEADTYKISTIANSTSTMHKLASTPITIDCFEIDDYYSSIVDLKDPNPWTAQFRVDKGVDSFLNFLEELRKRYNETKDKRYWKELVRWLPEGWLQKRTWTANYEVLRNIYHQRKNHKLTEWESFRKWCEHLPYANEFIIN